MPGRRGRRVWPDVVAITGVDAAATPVEKPRGRTPSPTAMSIEPVEVDNIEGFSKSPGDAWTPRQAAAAAAPDRNVDALVQIDNFGRAGNWASGGVLFSSGGS